MQLINQSAELIKQEPTEEGLLKHIERCGRVCYKSEDKITPDSAKRFVDMLIKSGHLSVLEHGEVFADYFTLGWSSKSKYIRDTNTFPKYGVSNLRYLVEEYPESYLQHITYLPNDTKAEKKHRRVTFHIITSRGILDELLRHRTLSASVESTRFCNYSRDKFGNELTFVKQTNWDELTAGVQVDLMELYTKAEDYYNRLTRAVKPQIARSVLPLNIKSEAYLTAFVDDWIDICKKRIIKQAHPDAVALCTDIRNQLIEHGYCTYEDFTTLDL